MNNNIKMLFIGNDWRTKHLEEELKKLVSKFAKIEFDPIPAIYKFSAALSTFHPDKRVWWTKYQWHPLVQRGRQKRLIKLIEERGIDFNVLFMWSSWFDPLVKTKYQHIPFFYYIDQSCNKVVDSWDPVNSKTLNKSRLNFNRVQNQSYKRCSGIFCMSSWTKTQTLESHKNIDSNKVVKVGWGPIGVNLLEEEMISSYENPCVLFVGNEFYRKGVDILLKAVSLVVNSVPNVKFNIVGKNNERMKIEQHLNIDLIGEIKDVEKLKQYYREATVFVLPQRFDRNPHVLIEAMSAGKPLIASKQGGAPDVVHHGENGFIIDVGNADALAKYIIELLTDKEKVARFGKKSRELFLKEYTWEKIAGKIVLNMEERLK